LKTNFLKIKVLKTKLQVFIIQLSFPRKSNKSRMGALPFFKLIFKISGIIHYFSF